MKNNELFRVIESQSAPRFKGPFSQALMPTKHGVSVELSGMVGADPQTNQLVGDTIETQTEQTLRNIAAVLAEAGLELSNVIKTRVYLTDLKTDYARMNLAYGEYFGDHKPTRTTIGVKELPLGAKVEIEVTAWKSF